MLAGRRQEADRTGVAASNGRTGDQIDRAFIVEIVNLEPALRRGKLPSEPVHEHAFAIMVHLHQECSMLQPVLWQDYVDHVLWSAKRRGHMQPR